MQISGSIELVAVKGYPTQRGESLPSAVEAPTREETLAKLEEWLQAQPRKGTEVVPVNLTLTPAKHLWLEFACMFKGNPLLEEWKQDMADSRRENKDWPQ